MLIEIVMIIFILLLLFTAWYLWHRRNGHFLIFDVGGDPRLNSILKSTSVALVIESVVGIIILFIGNKYLNLITLFSAMLTILIFGLSFKQKKE